MIGEGFSFSPGLGEKRVGRGKVFLGVSILILLACMASSQSLFDFARHAWLGARGVLFFRVGPLVPSVGFSTRCRG